VLDLGVGGAAEGAQQAVVALGGAIEAYLAVVLLIGALLPIVQEDLFLLPELLVCTLKVEIVEPCSTYNSLPGSLVRSAMPTVVPLGKV